MTDKTDKIDTDNMLHTNTYTILPMLLLVSLIISCDPSPQAADPSTRFETDSLAILSKANQYRLDKEYDLAIALFDSAFLVPVKSPEHPDGLTPDEARRLMALAVRGLMFTYNHSRRIADGHEHFVRLREMNHPILTTHCRREILVCDAQMLQTLGRRAEACQLLDEAMALNENNDPGSELFCTIAAGITYMAVDSTETKAEPTLLRAAQAVRNGAYDDTGLYPQAMANLANIYIRKNEYQKGIELCQEVIEQSEKVNNYRGVMLAAINLCGTHTELNFLDQALYYNDLGLQYFAPDNDSWGMAASLYERRADIYTRMGKTDSAFYALNLADSFYVRATNPRGQIRVALGMLEAKAECPDSVANVLAGYERIKDDVPGYMSLSYHMGYGKAMYLAGRYREAIPLLEEAVRLARVRQDMETENHSNRLLLDCYQRMGRLDDARLLLPRYNMIVDSVVHHKSIRESIASHIRYETDKVEQQNRLLSTEVALRNSTLRVYTIAAVALGIFVLLLGTLLWMRHRMASIRLNEKERELQRIIGSRQELHQRNRELLRQLNDIQASTQCDAGLDRLMETLNLAMLTPDEEKQFRAAFTNLYPLALHRLREACPGITKNEELLSMLIFLNQSTEEMARILGIAPTSVTRIRYRLRPKMNLKDKNGLEAEIKRVMKGEN